MFFLIKVKTDKRSADQEETWSIFHWPFHIAAEYQAFSCSSPEFLFGNLLLLSDVHEGQIL